MTVRMAYFRLFCVLAVVGLPVWPAQGQPHQSQDSATLQGTVRDSQGRPIGSALVTLQAKDPERNLSTRTGAAGNYVFQALPAGTYTIRVEPGASGQAAVEPVVLAARETKNVDLTLEYPFFDEPDFIVAGVTDNVSHGGHGSDTVLRSAEALARATVSLGQEAPAPVTEQALRQAIEREPANADLHHSLAAFEESHGRALDAVREYQRAAELDASERNLFDWGADLLVHRAAEPATTVFAKGHRLHPRSVRMLLGLAVAWYARGGYEQAARHFFAACDLNPDDAGPYAFLGKVQSAEITQSAGYLERLERFAKLRPDDAWANLYYAAGLWKQRKGPEDAATPAHVRSLLEKAVRLNPGLGAGYLQLGVLYSEQRDYANAIAAYQKAIAASPDLEEAHYRLGQAYRRTGENAKARAELETYQRMSRKSLEEAERGRREVQQFVIELRRAPAR